MALAAPTNPDLPGSWLVPGVYTALDLTGSGAGLSNVQKRLLLLAYKDTGGTQAVDTPVQVTGQSTANTYFGRGSDMARLFAAAQSQNGGGAIDIFCCAITPPSGGTASTHLITFAGTATTAGSVRVTICGYSTEVAIASGDGATAIGAAVSTAINLLKDIPVTAGAGSGTVTLTYRHKGVVGNDLPIMVDFTGASGVTASPGTVAYATNASGAGSATVTIGSTTITASISNTDTPTVVAAAMATAINAGAYPVTASADTGTLTLFYAPGRVVHRISAAIVTSTGITATAAVGTAGAGTPTLTTALANIAKMSAFKTWATAFNEVTSLGTMSTHIETYADGRSQKDQQLFAAGTDALATVGAVPTGTTPLLTASPRYAVGVCPDSPQQSWELSARYAAAVCALDFAPTNLDGVQLKSKTDTVPLLLPHTSVRLSPEEANSAMYSYYLTPFVVDEQTSQLQIMRARTTSNSSDQRLWEVSVISTLGYYRYDINQFLRSRFRNKIFKASGTPRTTNAITADNVKDALYERMVSWDDADLFDGAASVRDQIQVNQDPLVPTRINAFLPCKPPLPVHQISVVASPV
jgi:phage tail sheath gpL-like